MNSIEFALENNKDFCYETNFDTYPIFWAEKFKSKGFTIDLIFFCLENQYIARQRVEERTEFKGHYVDYKTIDLIMESWMMEPTHRGCLAGESLNYQTREASRKAG